MKFSSGLARSLATIIIFSMLSSCGGNRRVIVDDPPAVIRGAIDSNQWVFVPRQVLPQFGRTQRVNGNFSVTVVPGKMQVYLPYFGKAYGGSDVITGSNPLDFSSTDFSLDKQLNRVAEWRVGITPKDTREIQAMIFTLFENGTASLNVTLSNRSSISYEGYLTPVRPAVGQ